MAIERYSASFVKTGAVNSGAVYAEMIAGATNPVSVRSIFVVAQSAAGGNVALSRSFAVGTGTTIHTGVCHRTAASATGNDARLQSAWSSAPTGFVSKLRSTVLQNATGQAFDLWREDDGPLVIEPSQSILLVNHGSGIDGGGMQINVTWETGTR